MLLFVLFITSVLSQHVTFESVKVQYLSEDYEEYTAEINSTNNLKDGLGEDGIKRLMVIGGAPIRVVYKDAFADFPFMKILILRQHGVEEIEPGAFRNVPSLEILRLNGNKLKEIKQGVFNNLNVVFLNLDHNRLERISSQAFDNLTKLEVLDLSYNNLKEFHSNWLKDKPVLSSVSLTYNEIEELPDGALAYYHQEIDLSNNMIRNISRRIFGSENKTNFGQLYLNDNYIEEWKETFLQGVKIRVLDLSRNKLECLEGEFKQFFVAFRTRIDGNPWKCECLEKIEKWVSEQKMRMNLKNSRRNCNFTMT